MQFWFWKTRIDTIKMQLFSINGLKIGYLSKENAIEYRKNLISLNQANSNAGCKAKIVGGWDDGKGDEGFFWS